MKLANFLAAHAMRTPQREAIKSPDATVTFAQVEADSTRLANSLIERGLKIGDRVAVSMGNRVEFLTAFMGAVKAGGIVVTPNPRLSVSELKFILSDATPAAFIYDRETLEQLVETEDSSWTHGLHYNVDLSEGREDVSEFEEIGLPLLSRQPSHKILRDIPPEFDDCMISYTSGTTGRPKGVILTQANYITSNGFLNAQQLGMGADDRILTTTPLAHRTAFGRLMNVVCLGSSLVIMERLDVKLAAQLIEYERITTLGMVTTVARMLLPEIEASPDRFRTLNKATVTGESFPIDVKERLLKALPQLRLFSFFAMTEVGAITLLGGEEQFTKGASVGRVNPGVEVKLVDERDAEVTDGAGEILVRAGPPGSYVTMRGYFNRPDETAQALNNGWLRTGDVGQFDEDGYLYIVDRKKDMVLSGGYNIYCKEVEACIGEIPEVSDAAVIGVPDSMFGESVAAFLELRPGSEIDAQRVVDHCRNRMASYKKPKYVHVVNFLPRNSMGKVLKTQLRELAAVIFSAEPTPPSNNANG